MPGAGRYTVVRKLADGGMAELYLGIQHGAAGFARPVVIKAIRAAASTADPHFRNHLVDEAHIAMSLAHSNIVQVLDLGSAGGRDFLILELVDGWDLDRVLREAREPCAAHAPQPGAARGRRGLPRPRLRARKDPERQAPGHRPPRREPA